MDTPVGDTAPDRYDFAYEQLQAELQEARCQNVATESLLQAQQSLALLTEPVRANSQENASRDNPAQINLSATNYAWQENGIHYRVMALISWRYDENGRFMGMNHLGVGVSISNGQSEHPTVPIQRAQFNVFPHAETRDGVLAWARDEEGASMNHEPFQATTSADSLLRLVQSLEIARRQAGTTPMMQNLTLARRTLEEVSAA